MRGGVTPPETSFTANSAASTVKSKMGRLVVVVVVVMVVYKIAE
jgi:hypothetical protein